MYYIKAGDEVQKSRHKKISIISYLQGSSWKIHPDWWVIFVLKMGYARINVNKMGRFDGYCTYSNQCLLECSGALCMICAWIEKAYIWESSVSCQTKLMKKCIWEMLLLLGYGSPPPPPKKKQRKLYVRTETKGQCFY
jgi:hypothetical protein